MRFVAAFSSLLAFVSTAFALSSSLQQVTANYNSLNPSGAGTPSNAGFYYYKPSQLAVPTPLIVAVHYCSGTAQAYYTGTQYASLADTHGYILIYPNSPWSGTCWDVNSDQTLKHNGGSDSLAIVNMVRYAIANWGVDASQVYVTGTSSGAMMTNVLIGAYPDVFYGGSAFSGVAFGCFGNHQAPDSWNSQCSQGQLIQTAQQWGDEVRAAFPGYTGARPKMQVWHGTADTTLYPQNFYEEIKEWTNVFGYSQTPVSNISGSPLPNGYSNATYGPLFQAILAQGVGHTVPERATDVLTFFGLSNLTPGNHGGSSTTSTSTSTSTTTTSTTSTTTTTSKSTTTTTSSTTNPPTGGTGAAHWGQCGGIGWTGATTCQSPYTCTELNSYYYQCL